MQELRSHYKELILSSGTSSIERVIRLLNNRENESFLVLNRMPSYEVEARGFRLYPYERPVLSQELKDSRSLNPLTIVTPRSRFEYHKLFLDEEIKREFPDSTNDLKIFNDRISYLYEKLQSMQRASFWAKIKIILKDLRAFYCIYFKDIKDLYASYHLPLNIQAILNSILFVFSGLLKNKYKVLEAVNILSRVPNGLVLPDEGNYSLRLQAIQELQLKGLIAETSETFRLRKNKKLYEVFDKNLGSSPITAESVIEDSDNVKIQFIKELDKVKGAYSEHIMYPYSIYIKVDNTLLNRCIGRFCLFIDYDDLATVDITKVFVITVFKESEWYSVLRVTSFMSYDSKDVNNAIHRSRSKSMLSALRKLMPAIDTNKVDIYPDHRSDEFEFELNKYFSNMAQSDLVYIGRKSNYPNNGGTKIEKI